MKQTILHVILGLVCLGFTVSGHAQVTIDQSNFLRGTAYMDTIVLSNSFTLGTPSEGPDQVWDYSSLVAGNIDVTEHIAVNNDPNFPNATSAYRSDLSFQGFPIQSYTYETVDANGWFVFGRDITDVTYSITAISGGPNDSLRFVGGDYLHSTPNELLTFPMNYGDVWTNVYTENTPFELTVGAFGLNKVPGNRKRTLTINREIAGYGKLTIPTRDGSPSAPMDVLLLKFSRTAVDSIFLGGAPAPPPLLAAFGLTQGSIVSDMAFLFYRPGFGSALLYYNTDFPGEFEYRPQGAEVVSAVGETSLLPTRHFPSPITAGNWLTIELEKPIVDGTVTLTDLYGRTVTQTTVRGGQGNQFQLQIPAGASSGLYTYQLRNADSQLIGAGKIMVK